MDGNTSNICVSLTQLSILLIDGQPIVQELSRVTILRSLLECGSDEFGLIFSTMFSVIFVAERP